MIFALSGIVYALSAPVWGWLCDKKVIVIEIHFPIFFFSKMFAFTYNNLVWTISPTQNKDCSNNLKFSLCMLLHSVSFVVKVNTTALSIILTIYYKYFDSQVLYQDLCSRTKIISLGMKESWFLCIFIHFNIIQIKSITWNFFYSY